MQNGKSFSAQVDDIVINTSKRLTALMRQSLQDVVNDAQTPVAKGGRMRVDTGFLRASGQASLTGMPSGPRRGERKEPNSYQYQANLTEAKLADLKLGDVFYFGWTAEYAKYRETYDGFLESALQNWKGYVNTNTETIRKRAGG